MDISLRDARKLALNQQGLIKDDSFSRGRHAAERTINRLSYLQIDTISVINRAHEHILQTRIGNYQPAHLDRLMRERRVFEYWSHAAAFVPFDAYRYSLPVMQGWASSRQHDKKLGRAITARIRAEGPLQSKDFEAPAGHKSGGWWEWKPAKRVLEHLFLSGELMVSHRTGFQKVFDLRENVIPEHIDTSEPTLDEWCDYIVQSMIAAHGIASEHDIGYSKSTIRRLARIALGPSIKDSILRQVEDGNLTKVDVEGETCYSTPALLADLPLRVTRRTVKFLSPFDNLVINRRRTQRLFGFDYVLECYLPEAKRQYGYFALPMLYGDQLIGRMDAKADRKTNQLHIRNLVLEPGTPIDDQLIEALHHGIGKFSTDHGCDNIKVIKCSPEALKKALATRLAKD